jgi:hypothetical protein
MDDRVKFFFGEIGGDCFKGFRGNFGDGFRRDRFKEVRDGVGVSGGGSGLVGKEGFKELVCVLGGIVVSMGVTFGINEFGDLRSWCVVGVGEEVGCGTGILSIMFCNFLEFVPKVEGLLNLVAFGC